MLAHDWVRKLMLRCGSRLGASRSAMRRTPPRFGVSADAEGVTRRARTSRPSSTPATRAAYRAMADPPVLDAAQTVTAEGSDTGRKAGCIMRVGGGLSITRPRTEFAKVGPRG